MPKHSTQHLFVWLFSFIGKSLSQPMGKAVLGF